MKTTEERINEMTFNEYLNFIRRSWREHHRRGLQRHSKEKMDAISEMKDISSLKALERDLDRALEILDEAKQRNAQ